MQQTTSVHVQSIADSLTDENLVDVLSAIADDSNWGEHQTDAQINALVRMLAYKLRNCCDAQMAGAIIRACGGMCNSEKRQAAIAGQTMLSAGVVEMSLQSLSVFAPVITEPALRLLTTLMPREDVAMPASAILGACGDLLKRSCNLAIPFGAVSDDGGASCTRSKCQILLMTLIGEAAVTMRSSKVRDIDVTQCLCEDVLPACNDVLSRGCAEAATLAIAIMISILSNGGSDARLAASRAMSLASHGDSGYHATSLVRVGAMSVLQGACETAHDEADAVLLQELRSTITDIALEVVVYEVGRRWSGANSASLCEPSRGYKRLGD